MTLIPLIATAADSQVVGRSRTAWSNETLPESTAAGSGTLASPSRTPRLETTRRTTALSDRRCCQGLWLPPA